MKNIYSDFKYKKYLIPEIEIKNGPAECITDWTWIESPWMEIVNVINHDHYWYNKETKEKTYNDPQSELKIFTDRISKTEQ